MKKIFKFLGILLLLLIVVFLVLGLVSPKDITVQRSTVIKAPREAVYEQFVKFRNWPRWSPWVALEPTVKLTYTGTDGMPGSAYHWVGDETGEGEMTNTGIGDGTMNFGLQFIKPWAGKAAGDFKAEDAGNGSTKVTWTIHMHSSFPMNALNFMTDKMIGKDFEKGLSMMKQYTEAHPEAPASSFDIKEMTFPATTYATIRKTIPATGFMDFFTDSYGILYPAVGPRINGNSAAIIYMWDMQANTADIAAALPVKGTEAIKDITLVQVPESPAYSIVYTGGYAGSAKAHEALGKHVAASGKILSYMIEEYVTDPSKEPDSNKWITNISYIVQK